jgi:hypothetical protein
MSSTWSCRTGFTPISRRGLATATCMHRSAGSYRHRFETRLMVSIGESGALVRQRRRESLGQRQTFLPACSGCGGNSEEVRRPGDPRRARSGASAPPFLRSSKFRGRRHSGVPTARCALAADHRHARLTVSLPTAPPNSAASARRTRRVLVPARYVPAISASVASVRR